MSQYPKFRSPVNLASPDRPVRIRGQYLARCRLSRNRLAKIAADLVEGRAEVGPLTVRQAAKITRVPIADVTAARRANANANANANGNGHHKPKHNGETLAAHIARSSPAERIEAARTVGVSLIWDSMIDPVITADQTAAE
jgi:hypothetical protein